MSVPAKVFNRGGVHIDAEAELSAEKRGPDAHAPEACAQFQQPGRVERRVRWGRGPPGEFVEQKQRRRLYCLYRRVVDGDHALRQNCTTNCNRHPVVKASCGVMAPAAVASDLKNSSAALPQFDGVPEDSGIHGDCNEVSGVCWH